MGHAGSYDVIVVGVGGMGASACMHLADRGLRVLGLEQFNVGHGHGSSHGGSRIVRDCYFEHPDYVPLLLRCNHLWSALEERTGEKVVHRPGVLYVAHPGGVAVERSHASGVQHGVACERLSAGAVRERFPQFAVPDGWNALFEPQAGFVRPERAVLSHACAARAAGATILEGQAVQQWRASQSDVEVTTASGVYRAHSLVLCTGAWTAALAQQCGLPAPVPLRVLRIPLAWLSARDLPACTSPRMPVWYIEPADDAPVYGVPWAPDQGQPAGVKVARHGGATARPHDPARGPAQPCSAAEQEALRQAVERFAPCAAGAPLAGATCFYTMSPDEHFVIDFWPGHRNVVVACGFSGHGFKFTPVVGEIVADLATKGSTGLPAGFLGLARFA